MFYNKETYILAVSNSRLELLRHVKQINIEDIDAGVHKSFHPTIRDGSTWSKFGARGEHGDVLRFSTEVFSGSPT